MQDRRPSNETSKESFERKGRGVRLRPHHRLMEPEELTAAERWDRVVELLALMSMPEAARGGGAGGEGFER